MIVYALNSGDVWIGRCDEMVDDLRPGLQGGDMTQIFSNRRIIVTGGVSGIGLATVNMLVAQGAQVACFDINAEGLSKSMADQAHLVDVTDPSAVELAVSTFAAHAGGLDGIVNSAGVDFLGPLEQTSPMDWDRILQINLLGPVSICRSALPPPQGSRWGGYRQYLVGCRPQTYNPSDCLFKLKSRARNVLKIAGT